MSEFCVCSHLRSSHIADGKCRVWVQNECAECSCMTYKEVAAYVSDTRKIIEETLESISCISCDFRIGGSCFLCHICRKHLADALCAALEKDGVR